MSKPIIYIFEGGAPDKIGMQNESLEVILVDKFESPKNSFDMVMELCNNPSHYMLICSENQLVQLTKYDKKDIPNNIIYLRSKHDNWNYMTKLNVLEIPNKYQLTQDKFDCSSRFPEKLIGKEWIIKKVGNSGGRGLIANTRDEAYLGQWGYKEFLEDEDSIYNFLDKRIDKQSSYIVQELVPSKYDDYAVSVLVRHGDIRDFTIIKSKGNKFSPKWYNFSVDHSIDTVNYLKPLMNDVKDSLGITDGFFEIECTDSEYSKDPKVIEINPRYSWTTSMSRFMDGDYSPIICYLDDTYKPFIDRVRFNKYDMKITETLTRVDTVEFFNEGTQNGKRDRI